MRRSTRRDVVIGTLALVGLSGCSAIGGRDTRPGTVTVRNEDDEPHTVVLETWRQGEGAGGSSPTPRVFRVAVSPGERVVRTDLFTAPGTYGLRISVEGSQETVTETLEFFENAQGGIGGPTVDVEITEREQLAVSVATE